MSFLDAARTVLDQAGEPLHYKAITDRALGAGLVETNGLTPWDTMNAQLATHIKRYGEQSDFMRTRPGVYALTAWGMEREPEPDHKARISHLPTWQAVRGFLAAVEQRPREDLTALRVALRGLKGKDLDFTQPTVWLDEHVKGPARALGHAIWKRSDGALNPRYLSYAASVAGRFDLLEEDDDGVLRLTPSGQDFLKQPDSRIERRIDVEEGVARVLALVAEHGPARSTDLLEPYTTWALRNTNMKSEATVRVSLGSRLSNLLDRGLVSRNGLAYAITEAGLTRLGLEPEALVEDADDEDKDELLDLVREINEQQRRVRERIHQALYAMDPYAFEHLIKRLLDEMGYDGVEVTKAANDKGVDVVGRIQVGITPVTEVIQAKRQKANVGRPVLDALRGSLYRWSAQRGTIITTASFTKGARKAAFDFGTAPIQLIDGERLVGLLIDHGIGLKQQAVKLWRFDPEPFEDLGAAEDEGDEEGE